MSDHGSEANALTPAAPGIDVSDAGGLPLVRARWEAKRGSALQQLFFALYEHDARAPAAWARLTAQLQSLARAREPALTALDQARATRPDWFMGPDMLGYLAYADRFAGGFNGVGAQLDWLQQLGVRYLHLLPFTRPRVGDNDGGFAVADYDDVDPRLGTVADLCALTAKLRAASISLGSDLVLNHTADDHVWARAAKAGDPHYRDFYLLFPDRTGPNQYEPDLPQIFPITAPGNFTWVDAVQAWVWTTFYPYQWDLNWANPHVFVAMAEVLMRAANRGVEVFRLDSTAFLWKRAGTRSMNQPEVHHILRALRLLMEVFAPGVLLKAEAIVPMRELPPYFGDAEIGRRECHLAYHSSLMAAAWVSLSRGDALMLQRVLADTPALPADCSWLTYVRCHDDIGWSVLRREADLEPAIDLAQVSAFYAGRHPESFAEGEAFQTDGAGVHGSNGMTAALSGVTAAERAGDARALAVACDRVLLMYGLMLSVGGLPMLYMGDEIGLGNDVSYQEDPERQHEGRWLHRPLMPWAYARALPEGSAAAQIRAGLTALIRARQHLPALHASFPCQLLDLGASVLAYTRGTDVLVVLNFAPTPVEIHLPMKGAWRDVITNRLLQHRFELPAWSQYWLVRA